MLEVGSQSNKDEVVEEVADHANTDTVPFKTLDTQPEELSEGECTDINGAKWL